LLVVGVQEQLVAVVRSEPLHGVSGVEDEPLDVVSERQMAIYPQCYPLRRVGVLALAGLLGLAGWVSVFTGVSFCARVAFLCSKGGV
jgi:hypothetical protein